MSTVIKNKKGIYIIIPGETTEKGAAIELNSNGAQRSNRTLVMKVG